MHQVQMNGVGVGGQVRNAPDFHAALQGIFGDIVFPIQRPGSITQLRLDGDIGWHVHFFIERDIPGRQVCLQRVDRRQRNRDTAWHPLVGQLHYAKLHHLAGRLGIGKILRRDRQAAIHPLAISHGANDPRAGRSTFRKEFDWTGTTDPTAFLAVPAALDAVGGMVAGGWPAVMARNAGLAAAARRALVSTAGPPVLSPESMLGSMAAVELPPDRGFAARSPADPDPLQARLLATAAVEVPLHAWPRDPVPGERRRRILRASAHLHNDPGEYAHLAKALRVLLADEGR